MRQVLAKTQQLGKRGQGNRDARRGKSARKETASSVAEICHCIKHSCEFVSNQKANRRGTGKRGHREGRPSKHHKV